MACGLYTFRLSKFITTFETMQIKIRAFGIAKDILETSFMTYEVDQNITIHQLRERLIAEFPDFERLSSLAFAINESYATPDAVISQNDEVVLIPPVSGG